MLQLCGPAAKKPKVLKSWFFTSKKPCPAAKNAENGAFLAHPEPEILLIEVAYFSAATEYTFSAHCKYKTRGSTEKIKNCQDPKNLMRHSL